MTRFKLENPGLRQSQLKQLIYKAFQKSPENPFNQENVMAYNATQDEMRNLKGKQRTGTLKYTCWYIDACILSFSIAQRQSEIENRLRTA